MTSLDHSRSTQDVAYGMPFWAAAPRQMSIDGRRIRLGGFPDQDQQLLRLNDAWQTERVDLLVIAPDTAPALAERALRITGRSGNRLRTGEIPAAVAEIDHPYRLGCVNPLCRRSVSERWRPHRQLARLVMLSLVTDDVRRQRCRTESAQRA